MPVYLSGDDDEKPYWQDVEKQRKVKLYNDTTKMTGFEIVKRAVWLCFCFAAAVAISGRSCGI